MENAFDTMRAAMQQARDTMRAADNFAMQMAMLLEGRLRKVDRHTLKALKRELAKFDATTDIRKWKATLQTNGKSQYLGIFNTAEEARAAYLAAKAEQHPFSPAHRSQHEQR